MAAMAAFIARYCKDVVQKIDNIILLFTGTRFPPGGLCTATVDIGRNDLLPEPFPFDKLFGSGILWAVPRNRRTIERRMKRRYGRPEYHMKILLPKKNLLICNTCGDHHEAGFLCGNCYTRVINETKEMQEKIQAELKLDPVEHDVIVLYNGEKSEQPEEFWKGKRIVEMKKERPPWFSKNLLQRTTEEPATSSDVKPTELA